MTKKIAFLFPGQGSQYVGMGLDLVRKYPEAEEIYSKADQISERRISKLCFQGPVSELNQTINTQPSIFVTSYVLFKILKKKVEPDLVAGHSLGEGTALVAASVLDFSQGLKLIINRAKFMEETARKNPGKMVAVIGLKKDILEETINTKNNFGKIGVANYNCPGQIVISGEADLLENVSRVLIKKGARRVIPLKVSGGFHSPLMREAEEKFKKYLRNVTFKDAKIPIVPNFTAKLQQKGNLLKQALESQITGSVHFEESLLDMRKRGVSVFVEVGPGKILSGLVRKTLPHTRILNVEDTETLEKTVEEIKGKVKSL